MTSYIESLLAWALALAIPAVLLWVGLRMSRGK